MIDHVISTGREGACLGALRAAGALGLKTGGWCQRGQLTPETGWAGVTENRGDSYIVCLSQMLDEADFVLVFGEYDLSLWSAETRWIVDQTYRNLENGGARSEPPREVINVDSRSHAVGFGQQIRDRYDGWYGLTRRRAGNADVVSWYTVRYPYQNAATLPRCSPRLRTARTLLVNGPPEHDRPGVQAAAEDYLTQLLRWLGHPALECRV